MKGGSREGENWLSLSRSEKTSGGRASKWEFRDEYECVRLSGDRQADGNYLSQGMEHEVQGEFKEQWVASY